MKILVSLLFSISLFYLNAQDSTRFYLADYLGARNRIVPLNASVLVSKGPNILVQEYFGYSNKNKDQLIDANTLFPLASSTKPFTATAIMMLHDANKLSINDSITKWLKDLPGSWIGITIKHLLSHTSGIPDVTNNPAFNKKAPGFEELVMFLKTQNLKGRDQFQYSNSNYILLSYIIEKAVDEKFETFMQKNIFNVLGMQQTGFIYEEEQDLLALPYDHTFNMNEVKSDALANYALLKGAGGMYSTSCDLFKFLSGFSKLITKRSLQLMTTVIKEDYGYGWHIQQQFGKTVIKHPGGINGYATEMRYVLEDSVTIIILSNVMANNLSIRYTAFEMMKRLNNISLDYNLVPNTSLVGKYALPKEFIERFKSSFIEIKITDGRLLLSVPNITDKYLIPVTNERYFFYGEPVDVEFTKDGKTVTIFSPSLGRLVCIKIT